MVANWSDWTKFLWPHWIFIGLLLTFTGSPRKRRFAIFIIICGHEKSQFICYWSFVFRGLAWICLNKLCEAWNFPAMNEGCLFSQMPELYWIYHQFSSQLIRDILKLLFRIFCRLEVPLVNDDDDGNGADGRHQEHDVEPTMVKIELKLAQNFSYNCPNKKRLEIY